jgi:hypothetical protein
VKDERIRALEQEVERLSHLVSHLSLFPDFVKWIEQCDLDQAYPDWREIVGAPKDRFSGPRDTPYREWLETKSEAYQRTMSRSQSAADLALSIKMFERETGSKA